MYPFLHIFVHLLLKTGTTPPELVSSEWYCVCDISKYILKKIKRSPTQGIHEAGGRIMAYYTKKIDILVPNKVSDLNYGLEWFSEAESTPIRSAVKFYFDLDVRTSFFQSIFSNYISGRKR